MIFQDLKSEISNLPTVYVIFECFITLERLHTFTNLITEFYLVIFVAFLRNNLSVINSALGVGL